MKQSITIHNIYISGGHDFKGRIGKDRLSHGTSCVDSVECVKGKGLVGDRYFGYQENYKGQVSFMSLEAIGEMENILEFKIEDLTEFRRNIIVSGVDLTTLVGKTFSLAGVNLFGTEQCKPCSWMEKSICAGAHAALENRGGLRCHILDSGSFACGEAVLEVLDL